MVKNKNTDSVTREKIFNAATTIFEEKGYAAARMQEIADQAGINKALLHYYFRSKDQLFRAVFQPLLIRMFEKMFKIFMLDISFKEKIERYYNEHISFLMKNPRLPLFLLNEISQNKELIKELKDIIKYDRLRTIIFRKHKDELTGYGISEDDMPQLIISIVSLSIFPFVAQNMMMMIINQLGDNKKFDDFMNERKVFASNLIISALENPKR